MSDDDTRGPLGQAVETLVYAPIGLFFEAPTLVPKLVEQGKVHARNARLFGKFAVEQGQGELRKRLSAFEHQASEVLRAFGVTGGNARRDEPGPPGAGSAADGDAGPGAASAAGSGAGAAASATASTGAGAGSATAAPAGDGGAAAEPAAPTAGELAITDYDSLSASQVVTRLAGLSGDELEAVRRYEAAHRGRKTILNKIAQLQAG
ncbi:MAG TPA: hypothetical protein VIL48_14325 [Acidimicrobiales bacterium]